MDNLKFVGLLILVLFAFIGLVFAGLVVSELVNEDSESSDSVENNEAASESTSNTNQDNSELNSIHDPRPTDEPIKVYIEPLDIDVEGRYSSVPREAMSLWEKSSDYTFEEVNSEQEADIYFRWVKNFGDKLGHAVHKDFVEVGLGNSQCNGNWKPYKSNTVTFVSAHELGHSLGFNHVNESEHLMRPRVRTSYKYDLDREELIPSGYSQAYPTCTQRNSTTYEVEASAEEEFSIYMLESEEEFEKMNDRESFSRYEGCSEEETTNADLECTVESDAILAIQNLNQEPINLDVKMEETTPLHSIN